MAKPETDIPLSPRARETLEKYKVPTVMRRDTTPAIESRFYLKRPKWIEITGREQPGEGDYPIYTITGEGLLALKVDALFKELLKAETEPPEEYYQTKNLSEKEKILIETLKQTKIEDGD